MLEDEDGDGDDEPDEVALAEERLAQTETVARVLLLLNSGLNLSHFLPNDRVVDRKTTEVCEVLRGQSVVAFRCQPTRRLLYCKQTDSHDSSGNELEAEGDAPDLGTG